MNPQQAQAVDKILQSVDSATPELFSVDGSGETEKIFLYHALLADIKLRSMITLTITSSGITTTILPGGRTIYSKFELPLQANESTMTNMSKQGGGAKLIKQAKFVIWDEASMAKRNTDEPVYRIFRDIKDDNIPSGEKVMNFGGDFRHVLPVVLKATRAETVDTNLIR